MDKRRIEVKIGEQFVPVDILTSIEAVLGLADALEEIIEKINKNTGMSLATIASNGLMSAADKAKLDALRNYTHPITHEASIIKQNENNRFVTDAEKRVLNELNNRVTTLETQLAAARAQLANLPMGMVQLTENAYTALATKDPQMYYTTY